MVIPFPHIIATALMFTISVGYLVLSRFRKPKIVIEDFEEEKDMSEDQPGVQSELEVAAVEYVRNANAETLAKLREAAKSYAAKHILKQVDLKLPEKKTAKAPAKKSGEEVVPILKKTVPPLQVLEDLFEKHNIDELVATVKPLAKTKK